MESLLCGKKNRDQQFIIDACVPNTAFEALDPVALATGQSSARVSVDTNDPTYVSGIDFQVAFLCQRAAEAISGHVRT